MRLLLDRVEVDRREVRLAGSKTVLERLAAREACDSSSEVLSFAREWRAGADDDEHYVYAIAL
jgi:hypothetical protein